MTGDNTQRSDVQVHLRVGTQPEQNVGSIERFAEDTPATFVQRLSGLLHAVADELYRNATEMRDSDDASAEPTD